MAFIVAGLIAFFTLLFAGMQFLAAYMSDEEEIPESDAKFSLAIGFSIAALVAASHYLPAIGW